MVGFRGPGPDLDEEADLEELTRPVLTYAERYAADLQNSLKPFGYLAAHDEPVGESAEFDSRLVTVLSGRKIAVVHVLAHGDKDARTRKLHVIANDGARTSHVESWLEQVEAADPLERPLVLFVLDICYAGGPLLERWQRELYSEDRNAWVIAACSEDKPCYDGRLTQAFSTVLDRFASGELRVDPGVAHIPTPRICREIAAEVSRLRGDGPPQRLEYTAIGLGDDISHLVFFHNPRHDAAGSGLLERLEIDPAVLPLLPDGLEHFLGNVYSPAGPVFQGRRVALGVLAEWLGRPALSLGIVTGRPGSGKSALLSVLVCAADGRLRRAVSALWEQVPEIPAEVDDLAVVHARHLGVAEITDSLTRQWNLAPPTNAASGRADSLTDLVRARFPHGTATLVLDALDEADRPEDVIAAVLLPLVRTHREDGRPLCRVVVGTRQWPGADRLFEHARGNGEILDLDTAAPAELVTDVSAFVAAVLSAEPAYRRDDLRPVRDALAKSIAEHSVAAGLPWGEFLSAGLYARSLLGQPAVRGLRRAESVGAAMPSDLRTLLEYDLVARLRHPLAGAVLSAVAHAKGQGMPEETVRALVPAFTGGVPPEPDEVREALDTVGFHLRRGLDEEGSTLYRVFHEGLAEELRREPLTTENSVAEEAER
ncbi:hypothetical protein ABZ642_14695 [Streptomyces sp. NPDC007157]|uniref:hypothetical protein n=1 Tax=Streptomyces sp. NPDC007157 TaxID=3154681 RepID=UPI00340E6B43